MMCVREFEFVEDEDMVLALPFDMEGGTEGHDLQDAVEMAADWLRVYALDALAKGKELPSGEIGHQPREGGIVIAVAVKVELADVPAMTAAEAARRLGVSTARVAQLCSSGQLESWRVGSCRMVSEDSVAYRLATRGKGAAAAPDADERVAVTG